MLMSMSRSYLLVLVSVLAGTASQEALAQHHGGRSSGFSHGASGFSHGSSSFSHHGYTGHTHSGYGHSYSSYRPSYPGFYGPSISLSIGRGFPLGLSYGSAYSGIGIGAYSSAYGYPYYGSSYRSYSPVTRLSVSRASTFLKFLISSNLRPLPIDLWSLSKQKSPPVEGQFTDFLSSSLQNRLQTPAGPSRQNP